MSTRTPPPHAGRWRSAAAARRAAVAILALGALVRLVDYLANRSLWLDEAYLTLNLMTRSYGRLVETLDYNQGAPIGFLWAERLALTLLGDSELALRFVPFLVGLAALALFYLVGRELLTPLALVVGAVLFATMEPFVRYSTEVKQYGLDVAVTLALLLLFGRVVDGRGFSVGRAAAIAAAGLVAVWLSHPAVFVLAGFAAGCAFEALRRRDRGALVSQAVGYSVWLASFLVVYLVAVRDLRDLQQTVSRIGGESGGKLKNLYTILNNPGQLPRTAVGLIAVVCLIGVFVLWRRRRPHVVFFGATAAALLAAGTLGKYPVGQRFLTFLLPVAVLLFAEGAAAAMTARPRPVAIAAAAGVVLLVLVPSAGGAAERLVEPAALEEIEPLLAEVERDWRSGDVLYLYPLSQYAFRYYRDCDDCSGLSPRIRELWPAHASGGGQPQATPAIVSDSEQLVVGAAGHDEEYERELRRLAGNPRVWLLYTHYFPFREADILAPPDEIGTQIRCSRGGASILCLYDFS